MEPIAWTKYGARCIDWTIPADRHCKEQIQMLEVVQKAGSQVYTDPRPCSSPQMGIPGGRQLCQTL